jgi:hypothetical protein
MNLKARLFGRNVLVKEYIEGKQKELPKDMNVKDYYSIQTSCSNCGSAINAYIKKGVYIKDALSEIVCKHCDCKLIKGEKK